MLFLFCGVAFLSLGTTVRKQNRVSLLAVLFWFIDFHYIIEKESATHSIEVHLAILFFYVYGKELHIDNF